MFLADPPRTQYDWYFSLLGIPIRVHPLFWAVGMLVGFQGVPSGKPVYLLVWIAVFFVSILVHEMGHALMMRYYGWNPSVTLYAMGGFARYDSGFQPNHSSYQRPGNREFAQIIIAAAGPAAGFLLAGATLLISGMMGNLPQFSVGLPTFISWDVPVPITEENLFHWYLVDCLLFINIYWGLVNLIPVYPLDGGQIARELFMKYGGGDGIQQSLWLSVWVGGAMAAYGVMHGTLYFGLLFGYMAFSSYQMLKSFGGFGRNPW